MKSPPLFYEPIPGYEFGTKPHIDKLLISAARWRLVSYCGVVGMFVLPALFLIIVNLLH